MKRIITGRDNANFVQLCMENQIDFLLVGGAAVLHHGCRRTDDGVAEIDLLVETSPANAKELMRLIEQALAGTGLTPEFTEKDLQLPSKQLQLKSSRHNYNLDILTAQKEWSYSYFKSRSELAMLCNAQVRVVGKADLIWLKEWTVKHLECAEEKLQKDLQKHRNDLQCLKENEPPCRLRNDPVEIQTELLVPPRSINNPQSAAIHKRLQRFSSSRLAEYCRAGWWI